MKLFLYLRTVPYTIKSFVCEGKIEVIQDNNTRFFKKDYTTLHHLNTYSTIEGMS